MYDYNSDMGFLTSIWGPMLWTVLHIISLNYPVKPTKEQQDHYYDFIMTLPNVLPCGACRVNMRKNMRKVGFSKAKVFKNRESFARWLHALHNEVNRMLDHPVLESFEDMRDTFEMFRAKCGKPKPGQKENGCVEPVHKVKTKCVLSILPINVPSGSSSIYIDESCYGGS